LEMSPYDLSKGRISFRHKDERAVPAAASAQFRRG
ncbi:MAG TPA: translation initiation factor IF-1, partial [Burkholderiales bacterium]|nr:translation initiation factor IF-1 [Burkholderiales bacterium]